MESKYRSYNRSPSITNSESSFSENKTRPYIHGTLLVAKPKRTGNFLEQIRIAIAISKKRQSLAHEEWTAIIGEREPSLGQKTLFKVSENSWKTTGILWVVPTEIFVTTPIEIQLAPSPLLQLGFSIHIFVRNNIFIQTFEGEKLSNGGYINFDINWLVINKGDSPLEPAVNPKLSLRNWKRKDREQGEPSGQNQPRNYYKTERK